MISKQPSVYNALYADGRFEKILLADMLHKGGAGGKIFAVENKPEMVAKIFHDKNKSRCYRPKLEAMLQNRPHIDPIVYNDRTFVQIAWPVAVLEDDEGFCAGYLMPMIKTADAVSLDHLMQKAVRQKVGLSESYSNRLYAAYNVVSMVAALHKCGHYIVDLKPANVSVYKENMLVAVYDCDGFSIKGEKGRYPAEYVSEEFIYPEGVSQDPADMGEEQDKFALAVIIFKLLNNGIHPFSGVLCKQDAEALTIQERIFQYHYAYGMWPDTYQAPHPYSMHTYFDKKTLALFDRAFLRDQKRPSAKEWQLHLENLFRTLKVCKKNPDHIYFTAKGCGLCAMAEKFERKMAALKEEKESPAKVRGMELKEISNEENQRQKLQKQQTFVKLHKIALIGIVFYLFFWSSISFMLMPFQKTLTAGGISVQLMVLLVLSYGIYAIGAYLQKKLPLLKNQALLNMLEIYALINLFAAFILLNGLSLKSFELVL